MLDVQEKASFWRLQAKPPGWGHRLGAELAKRPKAASPWPLLL